MSEKCVWLPIVALSLVVVGCSGDDAKPAEQTGAVCGNGVLDGSELCDDGNTLSGDGCSSDCQSDESCGNGVVDVAAGEACDDGNATDGDGCQASCALPTCGDGVIDVGEACDDGNTTGADGCNATCTSDESCGNGVIDPDAGEQCDDGGVESGDGCSNMCRLEICGNGILDPDEACDDGDTMSGDGCSSDCSSDESCGNGVVDVAAGEACDDGNTTDGDGCQADCAWPTCGDGVLDAAEACDDGNQVSADGCNATCTSDESCGNGIVDGAAGEQCDDGGSSGGDGCSSACQLEYCGNGVLDPGEICEDGNQVSGDGCSSDCLSDETCGNGTLDSAAGEQCDDGNVGDGDGCDGSCQLEVCGNGTLNPGEECDDGNQSSGDGCAGDCQSDETCGNGVLDGAAGEACDDGNVSDGDGCSGMCQLEFCGDGNLDAGEICDDGNNVDGDGCSAGCISDESCGNGVIDLITGEECDDGNTAPNDTCNPDCTSPQCGDGVIEGLEVCDDGNQQSGDGCSSNCASDETCGNGILDLGEACDDGPGMVCDALCFGPCLTPCNSAIQDCIDNASSNFPPGFSVGPGAISANVVVDEGVHIQGNCVVPLTTWTCADPQQRAIRVQPYSSNLLQISGFAFEGCDGGTGAASESGVIGLEGGGVSLFHNVFRNNAAFRGPVASNVSGGTTYPPGTLIMWANIVHDNTATDAAAIYLEGDGEAIIDNNLFYANTALNHCGAIWLNGQTTASSLLFQKTVLYGNTATTGAALEGFGGFSPEVNSSILTANVPTDIDPGYAQAFSLVGGNASFASPATGDFSLLPGSSAIDAGDPSLPNDLDGTVTDQGCRLFELPPE